MVEFRIEELALLRHSIDCTRASLPANYDRGGICLTMAGCACGLDEIVGRAIEHVYALRNDVHMLRCALGEIQETARLALPAECRS